MLSIDEQAASANLYFTGVCDALAANNIPQSYLAALSTGNVGPMQGFVNETLGETWELLRSVHATTDGDLAFTDIDATAPYRFFKVRASITQPLP